MHPHVFEVTRHVQVRSAATRQYYLEMARAAVSKGPHRGTLPCGNLAYGVAACGGSDKQTLRLMNQANVAIVSAYNDMLSVHQPPERFPRLIKQALHEIGSAGQFVGGVSAMCNGMAQGEPGMELSLASRDVIAMPTVIALSHNIFDVVLYLGVCDKIAPGLLIGSLRFGHLPTVFVPAGPIPTGISNKERAAVRQPFARGKVTREELLASEMTSYHAPGIRTFYGTASTNQLLVEVMGLHLPDTSFVNPNTPLRDGLTREAVRQASRLTPKNGNHLPMAEIVDEKAIVNSVVALFAIGGSTNHTLHSLVIAQTVGIQLIWQGMSELSHVVPTPARIHPNGQTDINHFQAAGGMSLLIRQLLDGGLLHEDVQTVTGPSLCRYTREPLLEGGRLVWREGPERSLDEAVLRPLDEPFPVEGGLRLMEGNLGCGVMKVSVVAPEHWVVEALARIFHDQASLAAAFKADELERDPVAVVCFQGPRVNGMPEPHKLTPFLGVLRDRGFKVALVTDGRMSGASGKVSAVIHVSLEAIAGGPLARLCDGDRVRVDGVNGELWMLVDDAEWQTCSLESAPQDGNLGCGRELFAFMCSAMSSAEEGACSFTESSNGWY